MSVTIFLDYWFLLEKKHVLWPWILQENHLKTRKCGFIVSLNAKELCWFSCLQWCAEGDGKGLVAPVINRIYVYRWALYYKLVLKNNYGCGTSNQGVSKELVLASTSLCSPLTVFVFCCILSYKEAINFHPSHGNLSHLLLTSVCL